MLDTGNMLQFLLFKLHCLFFKSNRDHIAQHFATKNTSFNLQDMAVLLVVTNAGQIKNSELKTGWYLPEVAHPFKVFKDAGVQMTFVSPQGGKAPMDPASGEAFKEDPICTSFLNDKQTMGLLDNTKAISAIDVTKYNVIFFAGGHGPMFDFPDCEAMNKITSAIYEKGGIVGGVCHGVVGLLNVKLSNGEPLVKGHTLTCFTNEEEDMVKMSALMPFMLETALVKNGAVFKGAAPFSENVQCSGNIFTGQNPASATGSAQAIVKKMKELKFL